MLSWMIGASTVLGLMIKQLRPEIHIHRKYRKYRNELTDIRNISAPKDSCPAHVKGFIDVYEHEFPLSIAGSGRADIMYHVTLRPSRYIHLVFIY
jgi:hypothetical protein